MLTDAVSVIIYSVYLALSAFWYLSGSAYFLIGSYHVKKWEMNEVLLLVDCFNRVYEERKDRYSAAEFDTLFDAEAKKLSRVLRAKEAELTGEVDDRFRNETGVKMKLRNIEFLATGGKSGLCNFSSADKKGYAFYLSDPDRFASCVEALKVEYRFDSFDADGKIEPVPKQVEQEPVEEKTEEMIVSETTAIESESSLEPNSDEIPYAEKYGLVPENYKNVTLSEYPLSVRIINCFCREKIFTMDILLEKSPNQLRQIRNFGAKCVEEVEQFLANFSSSSQSSSSGTSDIPRSCKDQSAGKSFITANKEAIALGDFSFADDLELSSEDMETLDRYKEAYSILGEELVFECYTNAEYCESIAKALFDFVYGSKLEYERHASLLDIAANLPEGRAALDAYYFIPAFTRNEEIRTSLNALCPEPGYSIKDLAAKAPVIKDADYALLTRFIKWCAFDVASDISRLFELLFKQPRTKSILNMRADNKTLDAAGKVHSVTRERIRQIEGKAKRIFNSWHNRTKVIYKIAALTQGSIALTPVELEEYFGENTNIIVFLLKSVNDSGFSYDEQRDVFYMGDDNLGDRLQSVLDDLPSIITKKKLPEIVNEAYESSDIPVTIIEKAIIDSYKLTGDTYHRSSLTLRAIYETAMAKFFPNGIHVYDDLEINKLRECIREEFGDVKLPENNRAIVARIANLCILCGRGIYMPKKDSYIPKALANRIHKYIVESDHNVFMTNTLFSLFEDELCACGIDNKYYLQGVLKELFGDEFFFRRDYISKDGSTTNMYMDIVKFIKNSKYPVSKAEIFKAFPGITEIVVNIAFSDPDVINYFGAYLHSSNLKISINEKKYFEDKIKKVLKDRNAHHCKDVYEMIQAEKPELLNRHGLYTAFSLFSVLEFLFREDYQFDRPYIAQRGIKIDRAGDKLRDMVIESDEIAIADISSYAKENRYVIYSLIDYVLSFNQTHFMRNHDTLTMVSLLGVDEAIAKKAESMIIDEINGPTPIAHLECIYRLPEINVPWNEWLVFSILKRWSTRLDVGTSSAQYRYASPIVGPRGTLTRESLDAFSELKPDTVLQPDNLDDIDNLIADYILDE